MWWPAEQVLIIKICFPNAFKYEINLIYFSSSLSTALPTRGNELSTAVSNPPSDSREEKINLHFS